MIFAPGELGVEAGADLEQAADAAFDPDAALCGCGDAREDLEQRAFPCSITADNAQHLALLHAETDIPQGPTPCYASARATTKIGGERKFGP